MNALLLACLLAASPARAAGVRVEADAAVSAIPTVTPLAAPVSAPSLTLGAPSITASPVAAVPSALAAPVASPAALPAAAALPSASPAAAPAIALVPAASLPSSRPLAATPAAAVPAPSGGLARVRAVLARARTWLFPQTIDGPEDEDGASYFHGTSLARLEDAAANGGALKAKTTYVSNEAGYPFGYARGAARKDGTAGVVLQFEKPAVESSVVRGHWSPTVQTGRERPTQLAQFYMAVADLPLKALTPASKAAVVRHYALVRDLNPGDASAQARLESVAGAVGLDIPSPRPLARVADLEPGTRVVIPSGLTGRDAIFAGIKDGKALVVEGRDGAWLELKTEKLAALDRVVDLGPVSPETRKAVGAVHKLDWSAGSEAEKLDRRFPVDQIWASVASDARAEIEGLRRRRWKKAMTARYVRQEADAALARILKARGASNLGFHFNLHGGHRDDYVGKGIRATKGDIALNYTMNGDANDKVYFFQTAKHSLYDILDEKNPQIMLFPSRMGSALNVFDLDAPELAAARADGRIKNYSDISMDFHGMRGVPYSTYLAPPLEVFSGVGKKIGVKGLSRDEETLATVRYLEAALTRGGAFVPGGQRAPDEALAAGAAARRRAAVLAAPLDQIPWLFKPRNKDFLYHGTTLDDLIAVADSGGRMKPEVSMYSTRSEDSIMYAGYRQNNLARPDNPRVLLQFRYDDLQGLTSTEAFRDVLAVTDRGLPPLHAAYVAATKPVPLSLMTPESKASILNWLQAQADARPGEPKWNALLAKFQTALNAAK